MIAMSKMNNPVFATGTYAETSLIPPCPRVRQQTQFITFSSVSYRFYKLSLTA